MTRLGTAWQGMAWLGRARPGMAWWGMAGHGRAWQGRAPAALPGENRRGPLNRTNRIDPRPKTRDTRLTNPRPTNTHE